MNSEEQNHILSRVSVIIGKKFRYAYRAGATITLGFGEDVECMGAARGKSGGFVRVPCLKARYALHVDCVFSVNKKKRILLSDNDLWKPSRKFKKSGADFETAPDEIGNNRYDEITAGQPEKIGFGETVTEIRTSEFGDLIILMTNGFFILALPYREYDGEAWRFFEIENNDNHLVILNPGVLQGED